MSIDFVIISLQNPISTITENYIDTIKNRLKTECPHILLQIDINQYPSLQVKQKKYKLQEVNMIFVDDISAENQTINVKFIDINTRKNKYSLDDFIDLLKSFEPENENTNLPNKHTNDEDNTCQIM
jgi:hypothetical protein